MLVSDSTSLQKILTVSELNRLAREVLEMSFPLFWVGGEISNFTRAASGHWYFSLKDGGAQVRCVMFKGRNNYVDFMPREGDKIEARATVTLYEARGDFQLTVEFIQKAGLGALFEAFERLKQTLSAQGLFDASHKKSIPKYPKAIGIVTSADAAALRDVLTTLKRRSPNTPIIIYPTPVQGKGVAQMIARAIETANLRDEVDTLIVCRGGGSMEDLWQFNEEVVARAIYQSHIPIISGVGHETDFTISDFVADLRAATPTAAAEMACTDKSVMQENLLYLFKSMNQHFERSIKAHSVRLDFLSLRLCSHIEKISTLEKHHQQLRSRLNTAIINQHKLYYLELQRLNGYLCQLNPSNVLARGYSIVTNIKGEVILDNKYIPDNTLINIKLHHGSLEAYVIKSND